MLLFPNILSNRKSLWQTMFPNPAVNCTGKYKNAGQEWLQISSSPYSFLSKLQVRSFFRLNVLSLNKKKAFKTLFVFFFSFFWTEKLQFHLNSNSYTTWKYLVATNVFPLHFNFNLPSAPILEKPKTKTQQNSCKRHS